MASGANTANARVPTPPPGIRNLVSAKTAELSKMWRRGTGQITWPDCRVFAPNPTLQRPPRLANLAPGAFKAFDSVVAFWRWVRVACPRCGRADTVAAQGWSKIRRVMGLVPHYLVGGEGCDRPYFAACCASLRLTLHPHVLPPHPLPMRQPLPARPAAGTEAVEDEEVGDAVDDGEGIAPTGGTGGGGRSSGGREAAAASSGDFGFCIPLGC
jgi:hypothetical protein